MYRMYYTCTVYMCTYTCIYMYCIYTHISWLAWQHDNVDKDETHTA